MGLISTRSQTPSRDRDRQNDEIRKFGEKKLSAASSICLGRNIWVLEQIRSNSEMTCILRIFSLKRARVSLRRTGV